MKFIDIQQNTPEWHEFRKGKIGASMAPIIMGVSNYQTRLQLYNEMVGIQPKKEQNSAMKRGHELESVARDWCKTVLHLDDLEPVVVEHDELYWCIASLDGYSPFYDIIVEIKCPNKADHILALQGEIPAHYYPQLQHQMFVTGKKECTYISFNGKEGAVVACYRNNEYIKNMVLQELDFLKCVQLKIPPDPTDKDEVVIDDEESIGIASQYEFVLSEIESMEAEKEKLKQLIIERCKATKNKIGNIKIIKSSRKGAIDYKSIPELMDVDVELYRKEKIEYWEISK